MGIAVVSARCFRGVRNALIFATALFIAHHAGAQTIESSDPQRSIGKAEFNALVDGRTVYFELEDGTFWGREYYIRGTNRTVFEFADGQCYNGDWRKEGDYYCYYYLDEPSCWLTFYEGDRLTVLSRNGAKQRVRRISDETLSCDADLFSRAPNRLFAPETFFAEQLAPEGLLAERKY